MKILITGGTGRVGSAVTEHLLAKGYDVLVIDNKAESTVKAPYKQCDIMDFEAVREQMTGCDAVAHLAAFPSPANAPGPDIFRVNVAGTFNVYEAAATLGIKRIVQASSVNAWGCFWGNMEHEPQYLPIDEEHPFYTTDPYSFSKEMVENIADYYWRRSGISSLSLRFPAVLPVENLEGEEFKARIERTKSILDAFAQQSEQEHLERFNKLKEANAKFRADLSMEYPKFGNEDSADYVDDELWQSYLFDRLNYWSVVSTLDAAQSFEKGLRADFSGHYPLFIASERDYLGYNNQTLARLFFPDLSKFKKDMDNDGTLLSIDKAKALIGFEPSENTWLE